MKANFFKLSTIFSLLLALFLAGLLASQGRSNTSIRAAIEKTTDKKGIYPLANGRISAHNAVDFTRR